MISNDLSMWPPPTNGMDADTLRRLYDIAVSTAQHTLDALKIQCEVEGHKYGTPTKQVEDACREWTDDDGEVNWKDSNSVTYFTRTCTRCGYTEKRRGIVDTKIHSPFT